MVKQGYCYDRQSKHGYPGSLKQSPFCSPSILVSGRCVGFHSFFKDTRYTVAHTHTTHIDKQDVLSDLFSERIPLQSQMHTCSGMSTDCQGELSCRLHGFVQEIPPKIRLEALWF